ncbi:MAG: OsmC family protein [Planctomycetota bacterium]|jgi:putative redox protein
MVEISLRYDGNLRCTATHGPSGAQLQTDAPKDNHGLGQSFSPTDLVATAYATCVVTIMGIVAQRDGIDITGARARVIKGMAAEPRRIGQLPLEIELPAQLTGEQRQLLENAARGCPVSKSISPEIDAAITFVYGGGDSPGETPTP